MQISPQNFLRNLFRIAQTLSTKNTNQKFSKPQTNVTHKLIALSLFAFIISACAAAPTRRPTATPISPPTPAPAQTTAVLRTIQPPNNPTTQLPTLFDGKHAYDEYLMSQMNFGIRPAGSNAIRATGDYIIDQLNSSGWQVETQEFVYRGVPIRNVIGKIGAGQGPLIILGAHYDTRPRADQDKQNPSAPILGANDGASGAAVLLELARTLDKAKLKSEIWLAFFDAEDVGGLTACDLRVTQMSKPTSLCDTNKWNWSVGAEYVAENLTTTPAAVIVVDMIGDANQDIYYERNSDKELQEILWKVADELGYRQWFIPEGRWSMTDDHTPFLQRGIRAIDIIDFDYPPWHTTGDTADKVSAESLERVGRVLEVWLESEEVKR